MDLSLNHQEVWIMVTALIVAWCMPTATMLVMIWKLIREVTHQKMDIDILQRRNYHMRHEHAMSEKENRDLREQIRDLNDNA